MYKRKNNEDKIVEVWYYQGRVMDYSIYSTGYQNLSRFTFDERDSNYLGWNRMAWGHFIEGTWENYDYLSGLIYLKNKGQDNEKEGRLVFARGLNYSQHDDLGNYSQEFSFSINSRRGVRGMKVLVLEENGDIKYVDNKDLRYP